MISEWDHSHGDRMKRIKQFDIEYAATKNRRFFSNQSDTSAAASTPPQFLKQQHLGCFQT